MYFLIGVLGFIVLVVAVGSLDEWITDWRHQRRVAQAPVVEDECPLCSYTGFNSYGLRTCPQCGAEVNVQSFVARCVHCGFGPVSYGPSLCDNCGKGLWCGTTVKSFPDVEHTREYLAMHGQLETEEA